jgi:hypothetical protein
MSSACNLFKDFENFNIRINKIVAAIISQIPLFIISSDIGIGSIKRVIPSIPKILNILLPRILPITKSLCLFIDAIIVVVS